MTRDLLGKEFGTLKTVELIVDKHNGKSRRRYVCECSCGRKSVHLPYNLVNGYSRCMCQRRCRGITAENRSFYVRWSNMMRRCYKENNKQYRLYGGRGIAVCDEWHDFNKFYDDMFPSFRDGLQLDRVDNNSNYCKENCRWATSYEQTRNQRSNIVVEYNGTTYVLVDLAKKLNIKPSTLYARHRRGANLFDKVVTRG